MMQIVVLGMDGRQISIEVEAGTAFDALRVHIETEMGLEIDVGLGLLLGERALPWRSPFALADLGIVDGVSLTVITRPSPRLLTAALDGTAKLWNSMTGECLRTLSGHRHNVVSKAVFSSDGTWV